MKSVSVIHTSLPALTLTNLRASGSSRTVDKEKFIASYIQSQKSYRSLYAAEGQALGGSWDMPAPATPLKSLTSPAVVSAPPAVSEIGSSILKPRVPQSKSAFASNILTSPNKRSTQKKGGKEETAKTRTSENSEKQIAQVSKLDKTTKRKSSGRSHAKYLDSKPLSKPPTMEQFAVKRNSTSNKPGKKRPRSPDSERDARLADRRERRRAKRAIVESKPVSSDVENVDQTDDDNDSNCTKGGRSRRKKKVKGGDFIAGLALMHGFSANNMGSNRLTLKPTSGFFHKGKASEKSKVNKTLKLKSLNNRWTESKFLNKGIRQPSPASESSLDNSSCSSSPERQHLQPKRRMIPTKVNKAEAVKTRSNPKSLPTASHSEGSQDAQSSATPSQPVIPRKDRVESIIWDIEKDDCSLGPGSKHPHSIVLDTRPSRWMKDQIHDVHNVIHDSADNDQGPIVSGVQTEKGDDVATPNACRSSDVSLRPSQSASQVSPDDIPRLKESAHFSRFFPPQPPPSDRLADQSLDEGIVYSRRTALDCQRSQSPAGFQQQSAQSEDANLNLDSKPSTLQSEPSFSALSQNSSPLRKSASHDTLLSIERELQSVVGLDPIQVDNRSLDSPTQRQVSSERFNRIHLEPEYEDYEFGECLYSDPNLLPEESEYAPEYSGTYLAGDNGFDADYLSEVNVAFEEDAYLPICWEVNPGMEAHGIQSGYASDDLGYDEDEERRRITGIAQSMCNADFDASWISIGHKSGEALDEGFSVETGAGSATSSMVLGEAIGSECYLSSDVMSMDEDADLEVHRFSQGKAILLGIADDTIGESGAMSARYQTVSNAEEDVAKNLRGHWLPQRY